MNNLFWLTDEHIDRLRPFFPKSHGELRVDDRRVLSCIIFINRSGLRWCDAPREYRPPKTLYNRWNEHAFKAQLICALQKLKDEEKQMFEQCLIDMEEKINAHRAAQLKGDEI